jgi:glycosyltransferase involved in cell wall biosynthesis
VLFALLEGGFMRDAEHGVMFVGVERPPADYLRRCEELKISSQYLPKEAGKGNFKFLFNLRQNIIKSDPDVLFLHGLSAMPAVALLKMLGHGRKPFLLVRETQANHLKSPRDWISLVLAHRFANSIVHLTDEAAQGAEQKLKRFSQPSKVAVIPNGLDTDFYAPGSGGKDQAAAINIGMQSRLQPNKDHGTLIAAFAQICQRNPNRRLHLHIAGDGTTYGAIKEMIQQQNLGKVTTLHGMLDQSQLRDFLQGLDIYVHSTHGETMSTAIMQAMSCGLPVIASNVAGVSNMVRPETGFLYEPGSSSDLSDKLDKLVQYATERELWGERARRYAVKHYGIAATVLAYQALISPT